MGYFLTPLPGLGNVFVHNGAVSPGCDPAAGSTHGSRDADKENRIAARFGRNTGEDSAKLGIAVDVQRPRVGVEHRLIGGAGSGERSLIRPSARM